MTCRFSGAQRYNECTYAIHCDLMFLAAAGALLLEKVHGLAEAAS